MEYRVQVYIRRKGETILDGNEYKTEDFDTLGDLIATANEFIETTIYDDTEYKEGIDDTTDIIEGV